MVKRITPTPAAITLFAKYSAPPPEFDGALALAVEMSVYEPPLKDNDPEGVIDKLLEMYSYSDSGIDPVLKVNPMSLSTVVSLYVLNLPAFADDAEFI